MLGVIHAFYQDRGAAHHMRENHVDNIEFQDSKNIFGLDLDQKSGVPYIFYTEHRLRSITIFEFQMLFQALFSPVIAYQKIKDHYALIFGPLNHC